MAHVFALVSKSDGTRIQVSKEGACMSRLVQAALSDDAEAGELTLDLAGDVLARVADYMQHHQHAEITPVAFPLRSRDLTEHCADVWDAEFVDQGDELALAEAAHYLDMPCLTHLTCAKIATRYWNRTPLQIAKMLKL
jgi:hypothetical protein